MYIELFNEILEARWKIYDITRPYIKAYVEICAEHFRVEHDTSDMFNKYVAIEKIQKLTMKDSADSVEWMASMIKSVTEDINGWNAWIAIMYFYKSSMYFDNVVRALSYTRANELVANRVFILSKWTPCEQHRYDENYSVYSALTDDIIKRGAVSLASNYIAQADINDFTVVLLRRLLSFDHPAKKLLENTVDRHLRELFTTEYTNCGYLTRKFIPVGASVKWEDLDVPDGAGYILVEYSTTSVIEFDIRGLIDEEYIATEKLTVVEGAGLNKTLIKRFLTTKTLPGEKRQWEVKISGDAPYYLIESISKELFRLMKNSAGQTQFSAGELLTITAGASSRPQEYYEALQFKGQHDNAYPYVMQILQKRIPHSPMAEGAACVTRTRELLAKRTIQDYDEYVRKLYRSLEVAYVEKFPQKNLNPENTLAYLIKLEPILEELSERFTARISSRTIRPLFFELSGLKLTERLLEIAEQISDDVIKSLINDGLLVDYDETFKTIYMANAPIGKILQEIN